MKKKLKVGEIVGYVISALIGAFGLSLMITGLVGTYLPGPGSKNPVKVAEKAVILWSKIDLGFSAWGAIFLVLGAFIALLVLLQYAKSIDREFEKAQRRAQRLGL